MAFKKNWSVDWGAGFSASVHMQKDSNGEKQTRRSLRERRSIDEKINGKKEVEDRRGRNRRRVNPSGHETPEFSEHRRGKSEPRSTRQSKGNRRPSNSKSHSPSGIRRRGIAAASSTTLEVSGKIQRKRRSINKEDMGLPNLSNIKW